MLPTILSPIRTLTSRYMIVRFVLAGGSATAVHFSIFVFLMKIFDMWYLAAATIGFIGGLVVSFTLQKYWTFRERTHAHILTQGPRYLVLALVNLALNDVIVFLLHEYRDITPLIAQICASAIIACETFFISSRIFRPRIMVANATETASQNVSTFSTDTIIENGIRTSEIDTETR